MEDVLQCGMIDLSEQILRLIFAGSQDELRLNVEIFRGKDSLKK